MAGSYGFSISCGWGVYSSIYACVMWTENTASNGKQDIFVCVWVASVRMFEADRGEREGGGGWEIKWIYALPQSHMNVLLFPAHLCFKNISVATPLTNICANSCDCVLCLFSLCVFNTSLCVHRWMWTYLTVVGFLFYSFINFINFVWEGTILFCGCGIEHLVRWQLGVTEMKGQWVVCCGVLAGPTWNGGFKWPARLNVRGRWEEF